MTFGHAHSGAIDPPWGGPRRYRQTAAEEDVVETFGPRIGLRLINNNRFTLEELLLLLFTPTPGVQHTIACGSIFP